MLELARCVRFQIPLDAFDDAALRAGPVTNGFAGWPAPSVLAAYFELHITCRGTPDPRTGYMIGIGEIDRAVRTVAVPFFARAIRDRAASHPAIMLRQITGDLAAHLPVHLARMELAWSPFTRVMLEAPDMDRRYTLRQQFDFAASHRLALPDLSDQQNREIFGHCARRHGHNYRVEVAASSEFGDAAAPPAFAIPDLDAAVSESLLATLDHTDLNDDQPAFARLLPSVEHIAQTCFDLVQPAIAARGGRLESVEVWETAKTSCRCVRPEGS